MFPSRLLPAVLAPLALVAAGCGGGTRDEPLAFAWPPTVGEPYPNLVLRDHRGERVELSSLRGKVLLIEPIGMT